MIRWFEPKTKLINSRLCVQLLSNIFIIKRNSRIPVNLLVFINWAKTYSDGYSQKIIIYFFAFQCFFLYNKMGF